jgi:DNA repair exonuclease SbcCD nuclease subunit
MHTNLDGFKYDNGREITNGVNISNKNIKRVFSGHIHKRQENKKFIYIGSPYHTKRSDINNIKGAYILDTINNKILKAYIRIEN